MIRLRLALVTLLFLISAGIAHADGASLYVSPETGTYSIGDTFQVQVLADTAGAAINAAEADITYDPSALSVVSVSSDGSILNSWPASPHFDNTEGAVTFSGVANAKYSGSAGLLVTITFEALQNAQDGAHFSSGAILAADGVESNIITAMHSGLYTIQPVEVPAHDGNADAVTPGAQPASANASSDGSAADGNATSSIPAPVIRSKPEISTGERIIIDGTAPANSTVSVWLQEGSKKPQRTDLDADDSGSFSFTSDTQAKAGTYKAWAFTLGSGGLESSMSDKLDITAIDPNTASVALLQDTLIKNAVPLSALLIFAGIVTAYIYHRHRLEKYRLELQSKSNA